MEIEGRPKFDSPVDAAIHWMTHRPVIFTTSTSAEAASIEKYDEIVVSGLLNTELNGVYRVTKVKRGWLHWYDPIINFFQRIGQKIRMLIWGIIAWVERHQ